MCIRDSYGDNLVRFLISKDFKVCVFNPIQTSFMRKNNVRKTKTDKVDTFVIAKTLMMQDSLRFLTLEDLDYIELKELGRFRQKLVKQRTRLKIQLTSYVDQDVYKRQTLLVVNARHMKNVPGKKTYMRDSEWISTLLRAGLLNGSFIPEKRIREFRDLNRYRRCV